jgi:hypothetical protein
LSSYKHNRLFSVLNYDLHIRRDTAPTTFARSLMKVDLLGATYSASGIGVK